MEKILLVVKSYKSYIRDLCLFSLPIIIGNLGHIFIGIGDVFVAAKHGNDTIAAISIATSISASIFMVGLGLMLSISPVLANFRGEKKRTKKLFMVSVYYSIILGIIFCSAIFLSSFLIPYIGFEQALIPMIQQYIRITSISVFGAYIYQALKEFLQSYEIVMLPNVISIVAIFVNIFLNLILVFGMFGLPEMGIKGLAVSSVVVRSLMGFSLFMYCVGLSKGSLKLHKTYVSQLIKVGYPISLALLIEFLGFNIIAIIVGKVSGLYAASHNIVLSLASVTFMVPLAISNAMAVKVGFANGMKNYTALKRFSISGVSLSVLFMGLMGILFSSFPAFFIKIFTSDPEIINICVPIMFIVALFQIFDGIQVALGGVLKGIKTTKYIMMAMLSGYWILGFPLGWFLAFNRGLELKGFWIGLAAALFFISLILGFIVCIKMRELRYDFGYYLQQKSQRQ